MGSPSSQPGPQGLWVGGHHFYKIGDYAMLQAFLCVFRSFISKITRKVAHLLPLRSNYVLCSLYLPPISLCFCQSWCTRHSGNELLVFDLFLSNVLCGLYLYSLSHSALDPDHKIMQKCIVLTMKSVKSLTSMPRCWETVEVCCLCDRQHSNVEIER